MPSFTYLSAAALHLLLPLGSAFTIPHGWNTTGAFNASTGVNATFGHGSINPRAENATGAVNATTGVNATHSHASLISRAWNTTHGVNATCNHTSIHPRAANTTDAVNASTGVNVSQAFLVKDTIPEPLPADIYNRFQCHAAPEGEYHDAHGMNIALVAYEFCNYVADKYSPSSQPVEHVRKTYSTFEWLGGLDVETDNKKLMDIYTVDVKDRGDECEADEVNMLFPLGGEELYDRKDGFCRSLLYGFWRYCYNNKGQAGSVDLGCLHYDLKQEQVKSELDIPLDTIYKQNPDSDSNDD